MRVLFIIIVAVLIGQSSCKNKTATDGDMETKDTTTIRLEFSKIYDTGIHQRNVIMEGYFQIPFSIFSYGSNNTILFTQWVNYPDTMVLKAGINVGTTENTMIALPSSYRKEDLKILSDKGDTIRFGQKARIYGTFSIFKAEAGPDSGKYVPSVSIQRVEKIDEKITYTPTAIKKHTDPIASPQLHHLERVYIEGYVQIPDNMFGVRGMPLSMRVGENMDLTGIRVLTDNGPNTIHIPKFAMTASDVKLQDHKGNMIPFESRAIGLWEKLMSKKKIRAYGIWARPDDGMSTGDLYVEFLEEL